MEQPRFLTGWTPVVKTFANSNRAVKALWALFATCMVIALVSSVSVVIHKYLTYVTVVRLDQRGPKDGVPPPAVTVCLTEHQTKYLHMDYYRSNSKLNIVQGTSKSCQLKSGIIWDSTVDAISQFYNYTKHFQVTFRTEPPGCYSLSVMEQVPWPPDSICTTFQLTQNGSLNTTFWKIFHMDVRLTGVNQTLLGRPLVIAHETNSFPFDNFGRYLYEYMNPGSLLNIFYSKSITKRLHTRRTPCTSRAINLLGNSFDYDQITCQWHTICARYNKICNCTCPLELLRLRLDREMQSKAKNTLYSMNYNNKLQHHQPNNYCPSKCQHDHRIAFVNNSICPLACRTVTYKKLNEVLDNITERSAVQLELIQAEGLTELTEEALYSLPKLFSEIGGLSSFCFGFSCILFFELLELAFWLRCTYRSQFREHVTKMLGQHMEIVDELSNGTKQNTQITTDKLLSNKNFRQVQDKNYYGPRNNTSFKQKQRKTDLFNSSTSASKSILHNQLKYSPHKYSLICTPTQLKSRTSNHIELNPLKMCRVDGERLSEYPKDEDSPLFSLKSHKAFILENTTLKIHLNSSNHTHYPMNLSTFHDKVQLLTVPVILNSHLFQVAIDYEIS
ncbi:Na channel amiloride sensitive [Schistosoma japonicum]|nr:Na channel amiloride sensitive [Schistosoma japonicum]